MMSLLLVSFSRHNFICWWFPLSSVFGTLRFLKFCGRVYWGYSSVESRVKDSVLRESGLITFGSSLAVESIIAIEAISPPVRI